MQYHGACCPRWMHVRTNKRIWWEMRGNCIAEEKSHCINKTDGDIIHLHIKQSKYIRLSCLNQRTMYYGEMKTKNVVVNQPPFCIADADANPNDDDKKQKQWSLLTSTSQKARQYILLLADKLKRHTTHNNLKTHRNHDSDTNLRYNLRYKSCIWDLYLRFHDWLSRNTTPLLHTHHCYFIDSWKKLVKPHIYAHPRWRRHTLAARVCCRRPSVGVVANNEKLSLL